MNHYILKDKKPVLVDMMTWAKWFEERENRQISHTVLDKGFISTIFLGMDHSFGGPEELLFESMVFDSGTDLDNQPYRTPTYKSAEKQHGKLVMKIKKLQNG